MDTSNELTFVQEFFFIVSVEDEELKPIEIGVKIPLQEFEFTEAEVEKLRRLARRLELSLLGEFTQQWSTASVVVEVRSQ